MNRPTSADRPARPARPAARPATRLPGFVRWRAAGTSHPDRMFGGYSTDDTAAIFADEVPLRADLFSVDQLEQHAKALAGWHEADDQGGPDRLLRRLDENEDVLVRAYELVINAVENNRRISPAAEWMLDNFYLIEEQIRTARRHFPKGYSKELPHLVSGPSQGTPRVYDIALELISHVDGRVDLESLTGFVGSYQTVTTLKLGELWAVPIMLRLALIENLRRVAARIAAGRVDRDRADAWADKLVAAVEKDPKDVVLVLADLVKSRQQLSPAFMAEMTRRLQAQGPTQGFAMGWVEGRLGEQGMNPAGLVQNEGQNQAADQVSVGNSISSLRFLGSCDWKDFVEAMSVTDAALRADPADVYAGMDFATRDRYRHAVERVAKRSPMNEVEVAEKAVAMARAATGDAAPAGRPPVSDGAGTIGVGVYPDSDGPDSDGPDSDGPDSDGDGRSSGSAATTAESGARSRTAAPEAHVGYYLIDRGRPALERAVSMKVGAYSTFARLLKRVPLTTFLGVVLLVSVGIAALLLWTGSAFGMRPWAAALLALPAVLAASYLGVAFTNWICTLLVPPKTLPRLDFSAGVPSDCRTAVVVPTLLTSEAGVDELIEGLEVRYLANRDKNLHFALLTDFKDAAEETTPGDAALLDRARQGVEALNRKYAGTSGRLGSGHNEPGYDGGFGGRGAPVDPDGDGDGDGDGGGGDGVGGGGSVAPSAGGDVGRGDDHETGLGRAGGRGDVFLLLHRPRKWNPVEGVWMGEERKRGKLDDFNRLVLHGERAPFGTVVGDAAALRGVRYVITLDTDTHLPRDAAQDLVGTIAHPLNRAVYDEAQGRVTRGYGILQPRVAVALPSSRRSWFVRLFAGDAGIDPYTRAVSDVYQDVFDEGSFIGKGIYDVRAFDQALGGTLPENRILSHDLLEGGYARGGLVTDVQLYEDHPSNYMADVSRRHRWIRGDWQIASWLLPRVPGAGGKTMRNPVDALGRWKIFDNLRRSLVPTALLLVLAAAWSFVVPAGFWTVTVAAIVLLPAALAALVDAARKPRDVPWSMHLKIAAEGAGRSFLQSLLTLAFLPFDALMGLDAVVRTLWRVAVSKKFLLQWTTSTDAERKSKSVDLGGFYGSMWVAPVAGLLAILLPAALRPHVLLFAAPFGMAWFLAPALAWWLSRPIEPRRAELSDDDRLYLRLLARRTWRFFDAFVAPGDNYLPPDNFQEHPAQVIAHRTSPTNIGLSMLSHLAAWDFGFVSTAYLLHRTERTLATLDRMERHEGHFYNWYDTRTLEPLPPAYVSAVDSGNFTGSLLILRPGLIELIDAPILPPQTFAGLADSLRVLLETARGKDQVANRKRVSHLPGDVMTRLDRLLTELDHPPRSLAGGRVLLQRVAVSAADAIGAASPAEGDEVQYWARAFERQAREALADVNHYAAWNEVSSPPSDKSWRRGGGPQVSRLASVREAMRKLDGVPTLREVATLSDGLGDALQAIAAELGDSADPTAPEDAAWARRLTETLENCSQEAAARIGEIESLAERCRGMADADYTFLYDRARDLLTIGYNVAERRRDAGHYDLLASEARLTSFMAVANGQLPQDHWFALSRMVTTSGGDPCLLSWSGSMFEYLMPMLVMPTYENTLIDQTYQSVVERQIAYGKQRGVPWGISESGYNATDAQLNYQYRAFGVPGLGLKRGLAEDLVIAPYATEMSLMVDPTRSVANLKRMAADGHFGAYGFYEAIDYTPSRVPRGQSFATVRSFMSHHKGMAFLAQAYALLDRPMQRRFMADPLFRSTELLLQERIPKVAPVFPHASESANPARRATGEAEGILRVFRTPNTGRPAVHLLSNGGGFNVMVTNAGGGYTRWRDIAVTRWREDPTRDAWGTFVYLRDLDTGEFFSAAHQPTLKPADFYEAVFSQARAEFKRRDGSIDTHTEVSVSPEDDVEIRRLTVTNRGTERRTLEFTSYAEVVLAKPDADAAHPAFSNLFVQTQLLRNRQAILATRRARSQTERPPYMLHLMAVHGPTVGDVSYETDRSKFVGRGRTLTDPAALHARRLEDSEGSVLDPVAAVRRTVTLEPGQSVKVDVVTGVADAREHAVALIEKYHDRRLADRVFEMSWTHSQVVLRQLNATEADAQLFGRLASSVIFANPVRRAAPATIARNRKPQSGLWGHGISGDLPIVLLRVSDRAKLSLVKQLVQAHAYWRQKGLRVDLIIWNEDLSGYRQELQDEIMGTITAGTEAAMVDKPGGLFVRRIEQLSEEDKVLMQTVARVIVTDQGGTLSEQLDKRSASDVLATVPKFVPDPRPPGRAADRHGGRGPRAAVPQRPGRLHARRPRVHLRHDRRRPDARAVVQRARQPDLRHRRQRERRQLHVARERPRVPPDALVQRPRQRHQRRGVLRPRRGERPVLQPHAAAGARADAVHDAARVRVHGLAVRRERRGVRDVDVRGDGRGGEVRHRQAPQPLGPGAAPQRHRLRRVGAGHAAGADAHAHRHRGRPQDRRRVRPQPLQRRVRRARGVLRLLRDDPHRHRRPHRVPGPQRRPGEPRRDGPVEAQWQGRRGARPVRRRDGDGRGARRRREGGDVRPGRRPDARRGGVARVEVQGDRERPPRARGRLELLERHARHGLRRDARPGGERARQRLAAVPGARVPLLGAVGLLPERRRVRLPRPVAGRDGAAVRRAQADARADRPRQPPPVQGGRRAALVAPAGGSRRAHAFFGRLPLAAPGRRPLRQRHRRHGIARRAGRLPRGPARAAGRGELLRPAQPQRRVGRRVRALRAVDREPHEELRRARPADDRLRRLERRHEPHRRARPGRVGLARVLLLPDLHRLLRDRPQARRDRVRRQVPAPRRRAAGEHREARLGRRVVPPGLLRQRRAARQLDQPRVPDRLAAAVVVDPDRRRRPGPVEDGDGGLGQTPRAPRRSPDPALRPAVRHEPPQPRLHQGLRPRRPRERRAIHARGRLDRDGLRGDGRPRAGVGAVQPDQPREPRQHAGGHRRLQGRAVRRRRRRLRRPAPRRARRVDVVHRVGGVDVPARHGVAAGHPPGGRPPAVRPAHPRRLAVVQGQLPLPPDAPPHHRREPRRPGGHARDGRRPGAAGQARAPGRRPPRPRRRRRARRRPRRPGGDARRGAGRGDGDRRRAGRKGRPAAGARPVGRAGRAARPVEPRRVGRRAARPRRRPDRPRGGGDDVKQTPDMQHFLGIPDHAPDELADLLRLAARLKHQLKSTGRNDPLLAGRTLALVFEKPSLRTRVSFTVAAAHLGGTAIPLRQDEVGLGTREPVGDVARVLGGMCDGVMARTFGHDKVVEMAAVAGVPVVNGLTDHSHPCQAMADAMTLAEHFGGTGHGGASAEIDVESLKGRTVAYLGDANNVARSLAGACGAFGMRFVLSAPRGYGFDEVEISNLKSQIPDLQFEAVGDPKQAVAGADVVVTDTWVSMGQESGKSARLQAFAGFSVDAQLMAAAPEHAVVLHCLPAYRGYEISADVIDSPRSLVFPEAENRLHFQKGLIARLIGGA